MAMEMNNGSFDFFWRNESNRVDPRSVAAETMRLSLPVTTTLEDAISAARAAGMPKGSARTGCFEVQGPNGIWSHVRESRIDLSTPRRAANVVFKTWDELDAEDDC